MCSGTDKQCLMFLLRNTLLLNIWVQRSRKLADVLNQQQQPDRYAVAFHYQTSFDKLLAYYQNLW
jgi:hypothetical protein